MYIFVFSEYVKIAIPWSNLLGTSTEVTLELSGLYLVAGPIADRPYDKKKDQDHNNAIKQAKLQSFDESTYQKVGKDMKIGYYSELNQTLNKTD